MGRMIRIELYRAFHGKELKTAMLLGGLLGLAHFVLEVIPSVSHIFDGISSGYCVFCCWKCYGKLDGWND